MHDEEYYENGRIKCVFDLYNLMILNPSPAEPG